MWRKKVLTALSVILFVFVLLNLLNRPKFRVVQYKLNNQTYNLYLADTPKKWRYGLMYKTEKDLIRNKVDGMLFVFPDKQRRVFYNKNTYVNLKIIWINGDKIISETFLPSIKETGKVIYVQSPDEVDKVVELVQHQGGKP